MHYFLHFTFLDPGLNHYNEEGIGKAKEKPDFNIFNGGGGRETVRDGNIESRENHHASDINSDDITKDVITLEVVRRLIFYIHEYCWQVGYQKDAAYFPAKSHFNLKAIFS